MPVLKTIAEGWKLTFQLLGRLLRCFLAWLFNFLLRQSKTRRAHFDYDDVDCLMPPANIRARPDPYIYSQQWLEMQHIAVVWDNPDFTIIDVLTGNPVGRFDLKPDADYRVEATIHNSSYMAAIGTSVHFDVLRFGMGTTTHTDLGTVMINVAGGGTAIAPMLWHTPADGGHNCLRAIITHPDDANPLNNVGQHNTDIAMPAGPTRKIQFFVGNQGFTTKSVRLVMDSYRLPDHPGLATEGEQERALQTRGPYSKEFRERHSLAYLHRLQAANDSQKFPVPTYLNARLSQQELELEPKQEVGVTLEMMPPPQGSGLHAVNVHAYVDEVLLGGITAYVQEEGA